MLKKSNILALVGGGKFPKYSKNKIIIYDDHQGLIIRQIRFNLNVTYVKIKTNSIIGFIEDKIYIFNINSLETIDIIDIDKIESPIFGISNIINNSLVIAFPQYQKKGKIQIEQYLILSKSYKKQDTKIIDAHESDIIFISINNEGTLLASSSIKGHYIKIFNISNGDLLIELKKGKRSKVSWISFELKSDIIGYISDVGKVYIYDINEIKKLIKNNEKDNNVEENSNQIHETHRIKGKKPFAKFKINEKRNIFGFIQSKYFVILSFEGKFYKVSYNVGIGNKCSKCDKIEECFLKI